MLRLRSLERGLALSGPLGSLALVLVLPMASVQPQGVPSGPGAGTEPGPTAVVRVSRVVSEGPYRITPERRALLNTIRYAEGTWIGGSPEGYRVLYGGGRFENLERHPEIEVRRRYTSAAAGAYQFLPDTWRDAARKLALEDFSAASQDQAALYLMEKRGALGHFDRQGLTGEVLARLAPEWSSLPTHGGGSYYGQPVKDADELRSFYQAELARQRSRTAA